MVRVMMELDMAPTKSQCDLLGGVVALLAFGLADAVFLARMAGGLRAERLFGLFFLGLGVPTVYLLVTASRHARPPIYVAWLGLFLLFLLAEAALDYVFDVPFREVRWQVIAYVTLFFGALGGMIGVAGIAGRWWGTAAIIGFFSTALLAFLQHRTTGL